MDKSGKSLGELRQRVRDAESAYARAESELIAARQAYYNAVGHLSPEERVFSHWAANEEDGS